MSKEDVKAKIRRGPRKGRSPAPRHSAWQKNWGFPERPGKMFNEVKLKMIHCQLGCSDMAHLFGPVPSRRLVGS